MSGATLLECCYQLLADQEAPKLQIQGTEMTNTMNADEIEREIMFLLTDITEAGELEKICTDLTKPVPEDIRGKDQTYY